jgi:hypothetical protein
LYSLVALLFGLFRSLEVAGGTGRAGGGRFCQTAGTQKRTRRYYND